MDGLTFVEWKTKSSRSSSRVSLKYAPMVVRMNNVEEG